MAASSMKKGFWNYEAYVFDLDGTLYFQKKLRFIMASRLAGYYLLHFWRIKELLIIKKFRQIRDHWDVISEKIKEVPEESGDTVDEKQYRYVSECLKVPVSGVKAVILKWIYENPMDAVAASKDKTLSEVIDELKRRGKKIVIFSDYPTKDKLNALGISADFECCSADEPVAELKPSPKGLYFIGEQLGLKSESMLMIGDRMEKDGACAKAAKVDYLILSRSKSGRKYDF